MASEGLHVGLGGGLGMVAVANQADEHTYAGTSVAGALVVGYDWPIAPAWAFGLALVATGATRASLKDQQADQDSGYQLAAYTIGLSG
jgi:hypothetical protein